jgi:DNA mismatch repair ATPase MutL
VTLAAEEYTAVLEDLELLADCGFLCEDFGDGTVLVREVPDDVRAEDAAATLEELAQKLCLHSADRAALRDEVLHTVACKSAIKARASISTAAPWCRTSSSFPTPSTSTRRWSTSRTIAAILRW